MGNSEKTWENWRKINKNKERIRSRDRRVSQFSPIFSSHFTLIIITSPRWAACTRQRQGLRIRYFERVL